jgi:hypothetical protein
MAKSIKLGVLLHFRFDEPIDELIGIAANGGVKHDF